VSPTGETDGRFLCWAPGRHRRGPDHGDGRVVRLRDENRKSAGKSSHSADVGSSPLYLALGRPDLVSRTPYPPTRKPYRPVIRPTGHRLQNTTVYTATMATNWYQ
jgi:hypothetical protein